MNAAQYQTTARERDIQTGICQLLDTLGILYTVSDAGGAVRCPTCKGWVRASRRRGTVRTSWPDITGVLPGGRMLAIEVKRIIGSFRPGQPEMLAALVRAGALVIIARSIDDVRQALEGEAIYLFTRLTTEAPPS